MRAKAALSTRLVDWFVPASVVDGGVDRLRSARMLVACSLVLSATATLFLAQVLLLKGWGLTAAGCIVSLVLTLANPFLLRSTGRPNPIALLLTVETALLLTYLGYVSGGFGTAPLWLLPCVPLLATFFLGPRAGGASAAVVAGILVAFYAATASGHAFPTQHPEEPWFVMAAGVAMTTLVAFVAWQYEESRKAALLTAEEALLDARRKTRQLERARDEAQEGSRAKSAFLANMSHEIRTPLNGIVGMTALLTDTQQSSEQREFSSAIRNSSDELLLIVNDILDFSKIEAGRMEMENTRFDVRNVIEDVLEIAGESAHRKGLELVSLVAPEIPGFLLGDPGRLRQILSNLVSNAVKFTAAGEVLVRASLPSATPDGDGWMVRFDVEDTGAGLDSTRTDRLFEPFQQADGSTTRRFGGTGLGLAICKKLAVLMGGAIGVQSTPEQGSRFWVTLPFGSPEGDVALLQAFPQMAGTRVLVVDDNLNTQQQISQYVAQWGMQPATAGSAGEAIRALRTAAKAGEPFALAIIDTELPDAVDDDIVRRIEMDNAIDGTAIVLITPMARRATSSRGRIDLSTRRILKPVRRAQLYTNLAVSMGLLDPPSEVLRRAHADDSSGGDAHSHHDPARGPLVLVAEDHPVNQSVALRMLEKLGYEVDLVENGAEALQAVKGTEYAAILMDCHMPEMDGYEATRQIRDWEGLRQRVPIIALTASAMRGDRERCIAAGMNDYITKPVHPDDMAGALQRWTGFALEAQGSEPVTTLSLFDTAELKPPDVTQMVKTEASEPAPTNSATPERCAGGPPVDLAVLDNLSGLQRPGQPSFLVRMIDLFLEDAVRRCAAMREAAQASDPKRLTHEAHSLKSSASVLGAHHMSELCRQLEHRGRAERLDGTAETVSALEQEFGRVKEVLEPRRGSQAVG